YRLDGCELFVTLEPCPMCAGAILHARLSRVVFGAADSRTGAAGSVVDLFAQPALNPRTRVQGGVLAHECAQPLQSFFQARRAQARAAAQPLRDDALRTPDARFTAFPPPAPVRWVHDLPALKGLRMAWLDNEQGLPATMPGDSPVLCLHGPGQWSELYRGLWPLVGHRRLLVPDLIGHGRSDKPKRADAQDADWQARVLDEWLTALALPPVTLVFHPELAAVADALAQKPQRVARRLAVPATALEPADHAPWLTAPFPDRGHAAALRAWGLSQPPHEQLSADGLAALVQALREPEAQAAPTPGAA
ncbi:MAG: tRNA-specific adenosine deaminase, partial [Comamonadaceae bacterium]